MGDAGSEGTCLCYPKVSPNPSTLAGQKLSNGFYAQVCEYFSELVMNHPSNFFSWCLGTPVVPFVPFLSEGLLIKAEY